MERLTYRDKDGMAMMKERGGWKSVGIERLAAYEDTGLGPEEIERIVYAYGRGHTLRTESAERLEIVREIKTDRLRELVQAEKEARLVVLPCKVGDTLFDTYFGDIREKEVVSVGFMLSKSVKHMTIHANNFRGAITEIEMDRIGKDIFYTREAAEAALKGGESDA